MTRLQGERVTLLPVPHAVSVAVCAGKGLAAALLPLRAAPGWPHEDTADALRPHAEHGGPGDAAGTFLIVLSDQIGQHGEVIGECGWRGAAGGDAEIGYGLAPGSRGTGLATEALALLCAWVERQPGVRQVVAEALVGNEPSRRLLLRLGFVEVPGATPPYVRYGRTARRHRN